MITWSLLLAAGALLVLPSAPARNRLRALAADGRGPAAAVPERGTPRPALCWLAVAASGTAAAVLVDLVAGLGVGACGAVAARWWAGRATRRGTDPLALAAAWDLLAAGMRAGLPVPVVVRAVAAELAGPARRPLQEVADHLALGTDAVRAWAPALADPDTAELARAARRTARTGSGLAEVAAELAARVRATAGEQARARAQRTSVWISAPLGLCFLPAFLCLGVLPVVLGMVLRLADHW
ncbi:type II secretion system F family protein [Saccharopolyspora sp. CA-218241]|uniref:type II secretion system F family protein n=1 Tax=Saccharopolyspora sp. CA-218241 TaxID=3240027 RepID=UPI003D98613E